MKYLEPVQIGTLTLKNRLVMPPMASGKPNEDGTVSQVLLDYYKDKSQQGALGLVIVEHSYVSPEGRAHTGQMSVSKDEDLPGMKQLADILHGNNTPCMMQISHAGGYSVPLSGQKLAPSGTPMPKAKDDEPAPAEMTLDDIARVKQAFVDAALRTKAAGFDGVEIHSAHGYLLCQFYSPLTNHRTDCYGGSLENRTRLHCEIIQAVREAVGADFPIAIRFGAYDYNPDGSSKEEIAAAAKLFVEAGADMIDISGGMSGYRSPEMTEPGWFAELSRLAKQVVSVPVLVTGGITEPAHAEEILQRGDADLIGVGRALLKDSAWAVHAVATSAN